MRLHTGKRWRYCHNGVPWIISSSTLPRQRISRGGKLTFSPFSSMGTEWRWSQTSGSWTLTLRRTCPVNKHYSTAEKGTTESAAERKAMQRVINTKTHWLPSLIPPWSPPVWTAALGQALQGDQRQNKQTEKQLLSQSCHCTKLWTILKRLEYSKKLMCAIF